MSISYAIDLKQQTVFTRVSGVVVGDEMIHQQNGLRNDPQFDPDMKELLDCLDQEYTDMDSIDKLFVVANSPWGAQAKRAIVADKTLIVGLSHMFQLYMTDEHGNIEVFRSVKDAKQWLGIY